MAENSTSVEVKKNMSVTMKEEIQNHLERVSKELSKLKREHKQNPDGLGDLENRLYWVIRGVNPRKNVLCHKHNQKIIQDDYGTFICPDCVEEDRGNDLNTYDENLWFDPADKPLIEIRNIKYGDKAPGI